MRWLAALTLLACNSVEDDGRPPRAATVPNDESVTSANPIKKGPTTAQRPTPFTDTCQSTCSTIEVIGPTSRLPGSVDSENSPALVTHGKGNWYVAWGPYSDRDDLATKVQRYAHDGTPVGTARAVQSVVLPSAILWREEHEDLVLFGLASPYYSPSGTKQTLHRFDAELTPVGAPLALRGPSITASSQQLRPGAGGSIVVSQTISRTVPLVREVELDPALGAGQSLVQHDWFVTRSNLRAEPLLIDGRLRVAYGDDAGVSVAALEGGGRIGSGTRVLEGPFPARQVIVWSRLIGSTWWVGGFATDTATGATTIQLRRVDPTSMTPIGDRIDLSWTTGAPQKLLDANGTPVILGTLEPSGPSRGWLVPIDVGGRAACRPVSVYSSDQGPSTVGAIDFSGDVAAVVLSAGRTRVRYFTRLACRP